METEISKKYKKVTQREHVLLRPGMYIGPIEQCEGRMAIYDEETKTIKKETIKFSPGFFKTIDELIVNARDHSVREITCKTIKISFSKEEGWIKVFNDGPGIHVVMHDEHKIYIPELVAGHLLSSSNYDDDDERIVGGCNGIGLKSSNIYSKRFIVETTDTAVGKKKFYQEYRNNMSEKDEPIITKTKTSDKPHTQITYYPDFERFSKNGLTNSDIAWIKKRAYDIAACTRTDVKVYVNDEMIPVTNFENYIKMYYTDSPILIYQEINERWKVGIVFAPDAGKNYISFVNSIDTYNGWTHVNYIIEQVVNKTIAHIKKKSKLTVKPALIKEHLNFYIDATIVNPEFPSQTKSELVTKPVKFGSTCDITKQMMDELFKTNLIDIVIKYAEFKETLTLSKTDGRKRVGIYVPKLDDAILAGTRHSLECRLILTEGDSAKAFAMSGLTVIGQERYGVFPLRGKLLNVRNATLAQIRDNTEVRDLKKIMGLQHDVQYSCPENLKKLRYGGILVLTDADQDGSHIKGLIISFFHCFFH